MLLWPQLLPIVAVSCIHTSMAEQINTNSETFWCIIRLRDITQCDLYFRIIMLLSVYNTCCVILPMPRSICWTQSLCYNYLARDVWAMLPWHDPFNAARSMQCCTNLVMVHEPWPCNGAQNYRAVLWATAMLILFVLPKSSGPLFALLHPVAAIIPSGVETSDCWIVLRRISLNTIIKAACWSVIVYLHNHKRKNALMRLKAK